MSAGSCQTWRWEVSGEHTGRSLQVRACGRPTPMAVVANSWRELPQARQYNVSASEAA